MHLPDFVWLWRLAAWSMGLSLLAYLVLAVSGGGMAYGRIKEQPRPLWLRPLHYIMGIALVGLVVFLLAIGLVGTWGHFGSLGHSWHLGAGLSVVTLVIASAVSASQINPQRPLARRIHVGANLFLFLGFLGVLVTGWAVVQKYLPA